MHNNNLYKLSLIALFLAIHSVSHAADGCKALLGETDSSTAIISSKIVSATETLPEHCRVHGFIQPAVEFELKLPLNWNGRFFMVGNGGYLGMFFDQSYGLARGYATASTNTGHDGPDPGFALNNRAAEIDFAFRAIHLTVLAAKRLIKQFYGKKPKYSYYRGCSTGGRQGLMEVQRFADDFDGWSIGAPIYDYTEKQIYNAAWVTQALYGNDKKGYVPRTKLKALGKAVYTQCDEIDGLKDGIIDDPRVCDFDANEHLSLCPEGQDNDQCFSSAQLQAINKIYQGPGKDIYPGHVKGAEWIEVADEEMGGGWDVYFTGIPAPGERASNSIGQMDTDPYGGGEFKSVQLRNALSFFKFFAFEKDQPDFDVFTDLDFENVPDVSFAAGMMDANDPDLNHIYRSKKKIILWHGWADVGLNPIRTIQYYEAVKDVVGEKRTDKFMRLFMVPGMYHCEGGPGPDIFDDLSALEKWVEKGQAPERLVAYKTVKDNSFYPNRAPDSTTDSSRILRSRPLCPYPKVARYMGSGSIDEQGNFKCVDP